MEILFSELSVDTDYSQFSDFNCDYCDVPSGYTYPSYAKEQITSLSSYLSDPNGAKADLQRGYGVTTVAYIDGEVAGYYTLMAGSIFEPRFPRDSEPKKFPFICRTFPAIKGTRIAVSTKYQSRTIAEYRYQGRVHDLKISDFMFSRILITGDSLSCVDKENIYHVYADFPHLLGVRFIIGDALAVPRTLKFYRKIGFRAFMPGEYKTRLEAILETMKEKLGADSFEKYKIDKNKNVYDNKYEWLINLIIDNKWIPEEELDMGIPMFYDLQNEERWAKGTGRIPTFR